MPADKGFGYYSQLIKFEDFWHVLCQKYKFFSAILHGFLQNVCIFSAKGAVCYYEQHSCE